MNRRVITPANIHMNKFYTSLVLVVLENGKLVTVVYTQVVNGEGF